MVHSMVERATSNMLIGPDWAMNIEICDMLNQDPGQAKDVVRGIKKRIKSKNSKAQLLALTLLETIVKNCGDIVHMHVAEKGIPHEMVKIVKKKPDFHVKEKILTLIDIWQEAFGGPRARYPQYFAAYQELLVCCYCSFDRCWETLCGAWLARSVILTFYLQYEHDAVAQLPCVGLTSSFRYDPLLLLKLSVIVCQRAGAVFPKRSERSAPVFTPPQTHPLSSYPPNLRSSVNNQATAEASGEAEYPTLSLSEIQNARGIMDVLSEMLSAIDPANKEALRQEVIIDLVEQCRTYKQRVLHLVNSTTDEAMLCQGLALNDDLQKLLAKHESIVSGTPVPQEKPEATSGQALVDTDAPLVDTGESSKQADGRSAGATLPSPPLNGSAATPTKADPKIDLLSGDLLSVDDLSIPGSQDALALVPVSAPQPSSPVASQQNALAIVDMFSSNGSTPQLSDSQPAFSTEQALAGPVYQQNHNLHPQSNPYANGMATSIGLSQYEQSGNPQGLDAAWNVHVTQQQPHLPDYGTENGGALPPPPWESQLSPQDSSSMQMPSMAGQQSLTFEGGLHPFAPQPSGNVQVAGMYAQQMTGGHIPSISPQPMQNNQMPSMYPQPYQGGQMMGMVPQALPGANMGSMYPPQMYGNQMVGYSYGYTQQPDAQYLNQRMYGMSLSDNSSSSTLNQTSMASYVPPMKQQSKGDDKLFGDLVSIAKSKPVKPNPGGSV